MVKGKIKWASGVERYFECEDLEAYKTSMFGSGRIPMDVELTVLEDSNAAQIGEVEEGDLIEHQEGDGGGEAPETGDSDSPEQSGEDEEEVTEEEKPKKRKK